MKSTLCLSSIAAFSIIAALLISVSGHIYAKPLRGSKSVTGRTILPSASTRATSKKFTSRRGNKSIGGRRGSNISGSDLGSGRFKTQGNRRGGNVSTMDLGSGRIMRRRGVK